MWVLVAGPAIALVWVLRARRREQLRLEGLHREAERIWRRKPPESIDQLLRY